MPDDQNDGGESIDGLLAAATSRSLDCKTKDFLMMGLDANFMGLVPQELSSYYEARFGRKLLDDYIRDFVDFLIDNAPEKTEKGIMDFGDIGVDVFCAVVYAMKSMRPTLFSSEIRPETRLRDELGFGDSCFDLLAGALRHTPHRNRGEFYRQLRVSDMIKYVAGNNTSG